MLQFRFTDTCGLQYSVDGGTTWIDVPDWSTFASRCFTGPPGATGPAGPAPELRFLDCEMQVSTDEGATWSDVTGWSTSAIQACLSGTPGNPQGVGVDQQACNIANWLAVSILQGSMSTAAAQISGSASYIDGVTALIDLALGLAPLVDLAITAAAAFYTAAVGIGTTALNAAASDSALEVDITCAIYTAIVADGHVTAANFATLAANVAAISYGTPAIIGLISGYINNLGFTGINGIQGEGSLYGGTCATCGVWCYLYDYTLSAYTATAYSGLTSYSAGNGWLGSYNAGGVPPNTETGIVIPLGGTYIEWAYFDFLAPNHGLDSISVVIFRRAGLPDFVDHPTSSASSSVLQLPYHIHQQVDTAYVVLRSDGNNAGQYIVSARFTGTGTNPLGTTNCTP